MKITIENTTRTVVLVDPDTRSEVRCRVWEGETSRGVKVQCLIPRIAALADQDLGQFAAELEEQRPPSAEVQAFPLRMIL